MLILLPVILALLAGSVYAIWRDHEEAKAQKAAQLERLKKQKFDAFMRAQSESRERIHRPQRPVEDRRAS